MKALLRLVRLPNTLTAAADVAAGAALAGATDPLAVLLIAGCSAILYGGGIALGDVVDLRKDRRLHPRRPLPAGELTRGAAIRISLCLLVLGSAPAAWFGVQQVLITALLLLAILAYVFLGDRVPVLGVLLMTACRILNLLRGLELGQPEPRLAWFACLAQGLLILSITLASRLEEGPARPRALAALALLAGIPFLIPALVAASLGSAPRAVALGLAGGAVGLRVTLAGFLAPAEPRRLVARGVFGVMPLDALWAAAVACWTACLSILALVPLARLLARAIGQRSS